VHLLVIYKIVDLINVKKMEHIKRKILRSEVFKVAAVEYLRLVGCYAVLMGT